jgi:Protein of unknown function (DUF559)
MKNVLQNKDFLRSPLAGEHAAVFRSGGGKSDFATEKAQEMRKEPTIAEKKLWQGLKILRFWNNDVLQNIEGVLKTIADALEKTPHAVSKEETAAPPQGGSGV